MAKTEKGRGNVLNDLLDVHKPTTATRWHKWQDFCLWFGRYAVQIPNRSNLPHVASDSLPLQSWCVSPGAKPRT